MQNYDENTRRDLKKRAYVYALEIIRFLDGLDNRNDFTVQVISKQLLRSATSIGANVIEAQAGRTKKDFTNFLTHALKSANESKFWIGLLRDSSKAPRDRTEKLLTETCEIANILGASVLTLQGRR